MSWQTVFIDWRTPPLQAAATWTCARFEQDQEIDLSRVTLVVPGGLAGRRLLELLLTSANARGKALVPPTIVTVGKLPELLYHSTGAPASPLACEMAWTEALRRLGPDRVVHLIANFPPAEDWRGQRELGHILARLHAELSADLLDCASVLKTGKKLATFDEEERWKTLAALQHEYYDVLREAELVDPFLARREAIARRQVSATGPIVLVGMVGLDRTQRAMLQQVSQHVTALVFTSDELRLCFDEAGCLVPDAWQELDLAIPLDRVAIVEGPAEQASEIIRRLSALSGKYAAEEITLGVPDERLVPYLSEQFAEQQIATRYAAGKLARQTEPFRILAGLAEFLQNRDFRSLARLVRLPILAPWLYGQGLPENLLTPLDRYAQSAVPGKLHGKWLAKGGRDSGVVARLVRAIDELTKPLAGEPRPLGEWGPVILNLLSTLLGDAEYLRDVEPGRTMALACEKLRELAESLSDLPPELQWRLPGNEALSFMLAEGEGERIPAPENEAAVAMLGWLELPWDDAPVLAVCSLNEGIIPEAKNSDLFLPNELRQLLSLDDNRSRYARDAYALSLLLAARTETFLVVPRRNGSDEPVLPSRLLFACGEEELPHRTLTLLGEPTSGTLSRRWPKAKPAHEFLPPRINFESCQPLSMSVTEFADYLQCPYRYYLRHRLNLADVDDAATELDGGAFGSLMHEVLETFGKSDLRDATNSRAIEEFLQDQLVSEAATRFGQHPAPAVLIQLEQAQQRLAAFARWQAQWRAQGYQILLTEQKFEGIGEKVKILSEEVHLIGRIDRIDVHRQKNVAVVFDYKTGDNGEGPLKAHLAGGEWKGLQLPLYRHLVGTLQLDCREVQLGYILLPKDIAKVGEGIANWTADELHAADVVAAKVISSIRKNVFWPPTDPPPENFGELSAICVDSQAHWRGQLSSDGDDAPRGAP